MLTAAKIRGRKKTYFLLTILQQSAITQHKNIDINDIGMNTNTATVTPPKALNPIKIAVYTEKYRPRRNINKSVTYLNFVKYPINKNKKVRLKNEKLIF